MKLRNTGRIAIAGLAVVAALGLTACGSDDKAESKPTPTTTSAPATSAADLPPTPTAADLNAQLQKALDPNVPNSEKLEWIQGAEADPELPNRLAEAYKSTNATIDVTEVTAFGDTLNAKAKLAFNGQENIADVPFVAENGHWKVQKAWVCQMLQLANQPSAACPA
ncbi:hypothetical protein AB0H76_07425 [Nocardia sp. NPDC050712]|uniref:hypothetical protein n=1 Tax=Nocardia sp. NPDC050712 TaxID=3155518 RepID=UPI0033DDA2B0